MKRSAISTAIFLTAFVALAGVVFAQMMGGQGHGQMQSADSTKGSAMMGMQGMTGMMGMMHNMSGHCQMMSEEFNKLQEHFDMMMNMNDMSKLRVEMKKHQEMMSSMHQKMSEQTGICQKMMSMMHSEGMQKGMNMMGDTSDTAASSQGDQN
jgi:hypothetical protein